jgi:hypothetical protein
MARDDRGLTGRLLEEGTRLVAKAAEKVLSDPRGQDAVARAVEVAQKGRKRVEELQGRFMKAAGIPDRQDYQDLAKQLARIKRKAREIVEKLDGAGAANEDEERPEDGDGTRH